jgi:hypothetical protein
MITKEELYARLNEERVDVNQNIMVYLQLSLILTERM